MARGKVKLVRKVQKEIRAITVTKGIMVIKAMLVLLVPKVTRAIQEQQVQLVRPVLRDHRDCAEKVGRKATLALLDQRVTRAIKVILAQSENWDLKVQRVTRVTRGRQVPLARTVTMVPRVPRVLRGRRGTRGTREITVRTVSMEPLVSRDHRETKVIKETREIMV